MAIGDPALVRGSLSEQIVERLSSRVIRGDLAPGDSLPPEPALAAAFGVSKTAVREATKILAAKGLVTIRQGVGTVVNPPDRWRLLDPHVVRYAHAPATIDDLIRARLMLEPDIAALAAETRRPATLVLLEEAAERGAAVTSRQEHVRWDMAFHQALADATGNPVLVILMNSVGQLQRASREALFDVPGSVARSSAHHRRIFERVTAADAAGSRAAMLDHLRQVADDCALLRRRANE